MNACPGYTAHCDTLACRISYKPNQTIFKLSIYTRKYPLRGYILGVLTHTTAWDRHWGGDETLKLVLVYVA